MLETLFSLPDFGIVYSTQVTVVAVFASLRIREET